MQTRYTLRCLASGTVLKDGQPHPWDMPLSCDSAAEPAFLRTVYQKDRLEPLSLESGIYRFGDWLPLSRILKGSSSPMTYRSEGLARALGLENLFVTFSGYWPERQVRMLSGTFKECEAFSVCARMPDGFGNTLVVASAGNTARAFLRVCSENNIPLVIVIPEDNLEALWNIGPAAPCVRVVAVESGADYMDAIDVSGKIAAISGFIPEGGAKNVARRDGMGTTVLSAVTAIGRIPDFYFQAVGSGTGAIAAWEAVQRFHRDGRFGNTNMKLMLSQNRPFLVIHDSWRARSRALVNVDSDEAREQIRSLYAKVLSNRQPPYSLKGGLYDALADTDGEMFAVSNEEAEAAAVLFEGQEGIDICPAAAVAVASLAQAVERKSVDKSATIMLNVTGGGIRKLRSEIEVHQIEADVVVPRDVDAPSLTSALRFEPEPVSG
jgi:cysteate synthase